MGAKALVPMRRPVKPHVSDSGAQRAAEVEMLATLAKLHGLNFDRRPKNAALLGGLKPDAIDWNKRVIVEVYARVGRLKGAQPSKVKGDILKLLFIERLLGGRWKKIICLGDNAAANTLKGKSWVCAAAKEFGISVEVAPHSRKTMRAVLAAQLRQRMVNPT